jgi:hypothetical protein
MTQNMKLTTIDKNGNTPLHWAAKFNSQIALIYLLAWLDEADISIANNQGKTPLHIAVLSAEDIASGRTVRILVSKGAKVNAKDSKDRTALDTVEYIQTPRLIIELVSSLKSDGIWQRVGIKSPNRKKEKSLEMPIKFLVFFNGVYVILILFLFP